MEITQKITPFLSFSHQAEDAAEFYVSLFPNSTIIHKTRAPGSDQIMTVEFEIADLKMVALNVGQEWQFTDAFSLMVSCDNQDEVDTLWDQLTSGGREVQCGWLKDRYGVSWQIVPKQVMSLIGSGDPERTGRVMQALTSMVKLDIAALQRAYNGAD